ncbi:S1 family peptidase [Streptomyces ovatisporus]|uniref:S1 family peptidase n=1 Tax=Streptomyces ovatisporus TaxID=1128682 RepID=A0ABV9A7R0_9ACTN
MSSRRSASCSRAAAYGRRAAACAALAVLLLTAAPAASAAEPSPAAPPATGPAATSPASGERPAAAGQSVIRGGDPVYAPGRVCTLGFNATDGSQDYGIGSGQCLSGADTWYADAAMTVPVGTTAGASFPGNDYGLIRYTNPDVAHPGEISTSGGPVDITGSGAPSVGSVVCHSGQVAGMQCGTVLAVNLSVNYPDGVVHGLFSADTRAEPREGGTPAFTGSTGLGFVVASSAGTTYYQPVAEVLAAYGLTLL